jgi:hypothetical protein
MASPAASTAKFETATAAPISKPYLNRAAHYN